MDARKGGQVREHLANSAFGAIDYIVYPAGMLLLAPAILHSLGIERFGIWSMANAVLMTGAVLASGFGDANIRSVAQARGAGNREEQVVFVRSALGIHIALGLVLAVAVCLAAPVITLLVVKARLDLAGDCLWSLRITAGLILLRALETVCVSTQRAFSRYGAAIRVSVIVRVASLLLAWAVPYVNHTVTAVLALTLAANGVALCVQWAQLRRLLGGEWLAPRLQATAVKCLLGFGIFTWMQSTAALLTGQVDRLVAGVALGSSAIAVYTICVQLTQPIYGITAAGLHFLFPLVASETARGSHRNVLRLIAGALAANITFVALALFTILFFGKFLLRLWVGTSMAEAGAAILPAAAWGSALLALSVTGCYAFLAMGRPKAVAILNISGGLAMAGALALLTPRFGLTGIAVSRLAPGGITLLVYIPLISQLTKGLNPSASANQLPATEEV